MTTPAMNIGTDHSPSTNRVRAVGVKSYGGPEALEVVEVPVQQLGPGQVRVHARATAVSPTDTVIRSGAASSTGLPANVVDVPGMDVAGVLAEIGPGVETELSVGDRVVAVVVPKDDHGAYRTDIVLPAASVVAAPVNHDDFASSTLPMNGLTAWLTLEKLGLKPGQVLAVTGAAGTYGGYVVQLAKHRGLHVVADASEPDEETVRAFGADEVVRRGDDVAERIRALHPDGVDGLADGAVQGEQILSAVKDDGRVVTVRGWKADGPRSITVRPVWVAFGAERPEALSELVSLADEGVLSLRVADVVPSAEASTAHARLEAGGLRGRIVIDLTR